MLHARGAAEPRAMCLASAVGVVACVCYLRCTAPCVGGHAQRDSPRVGELVLAGVPPRTMTMFTFMLALDFMLGHVFSNCV